MESENLKQIIPTGQGMAIFLEDHGIEYIFGIPGGHTLGFYDGILATVYQQFIDIRDKNGATKKTQNN